MNWDRVVLFEEAERSPRRDETAGRRQSGPFSRDSSPAAPRRADTLIGYPEPPQGCSHGKTGDAPNSVSVPMERLIPRYRDGDRRVEAGRDLFSIGSSGKTIFNVLAGWVAVYALLEDGRRQIVQFALPGAILGVLPSGCAPATVGAQALTDVVVSAIPLSVLTSHSHVEPEIGMRLARSLAHDCSLAFDRLTSIGRRSARGRVAHLLLELFTRYRAQWPGNPSEEMVLPLTQEQIGDATGLTFVHVNRVLGTLRKEGIVQFHYRRLRILDPDRLMEVAGVNPEVATSWLERRPWA